MGLESILVGKNKTIQVETQQGGISIKIDRPEAKNSINNVLMNEILDVFNLVEKEPSIKVIILKGDKDFFCTGMDFNAVNRGGAKALTGDDPNVYYNMLKHITCCSKVVIAVVEGKVNAGGMGLVAASDIVIAGENATFGLSEALFGLLPACVMPFLIKRIGVQKAQWLTLMTQSIHVKRAFEIGLVDEISTDTQNTLRINLLRLTRLEANTIFDLKQYMSKLWIISDQTQEIAVNKITSLFNSNTVQNNIKNFIEKEIFPWDKK